MVEFPPDWRKCVAGMPVSARCMKAKAIENQAVGRHSRCLVKSLSRCGHGGIPARLAEMRGGNVLLACHAVSACSGCMTAFPACGPISWPGLETAGTWGLRGLGRRLRCFRPRVQQGPQSRLRFRNQRFSTPLAEKPFCRCRDMACCSLLSRWCADARPRCAGECRFRHHPSRTRAAMLKPETACRDISREAEYPCTLPRIAPGLVCASELVLLTSSSSPSRRLS